MKRPFTHCLVRLVPVTELLEEPNKRIVVIIFSFYWEQPYDIIQRERSIRREWSPGDMTED